MYNHSHRLDETARGLRDGKIELMSYIEESCMLVDNIDPVLQAFLPEEGRLKRLKAEGEELLKRYPEPKERPPLFGIPVGVKDIYRVDGFPTRAGAKLPASLFEGPEAQAVKLLKEAGALILGKTVTTEFAYFAPGPTRNPANLKHTPGGSSSGSAAAVAAGLCPLALGTQTIGSIIRPAAFCGIFGFKPSYGRVSRSGLIDFSPSMDHVGIFTQDLKGIELSARLLCSNWQDADNDSRQRRLPVLGVPAGPYLEQASPEGLDVFQKQLEILERNGYTIKQVKALEDIADINERHRRLIFGEMARIHKSWYTEYQKLYRPQTEEVILLGQKVSSEEIEEYRAEIGKLRRHLDFLRQESAVDIWVSPAAAGPAPEGIETTGSPLMNLPWTHTGVPALTIPAGRAKNGLPLGIQFTAAYMDDEILLKWAPGMEGSLQDGF